MIKIKRISIILLKDFNNIYDFEIAISKVVPSEILEASTDTLPPWTSLIILSHKDRPKPHPEFFVVNPGLKIFFQSFLGIPHPLSVICIFT